MLKRLFIDNFRCFVTFEFRPERRQLIFGRNGTGKSSFMDALVLLRDFAGSGIDTEIMATGGTAWPQRGPRVIELEALLDAGTFVYRVELEAPKWPVGVRILSETVHCDERPLFEFRNGEVQLYSEQFGALAKFPAHPSRSALAVTPLGPPRLTRFTSWLAKLRCVRLNPFSMPPRTERPEVAPSTDLSNIAAWLSHLAQDDTKAYFALHESLRSALDGFNNLKIESLGGDVRYLAAEFSGSASALKFGFDELSEGQRCLICLYTILHFVVAKGGTVVIDEPENFISLREIQPWLMAVSDAVEESGGQVMLISHHPELINQWAPECGVQFVRDELGPVRVEPFHGDKESSLSPAELIARGWENE